MLRINEKSVFNIGTFNLPLRLYLKVLRQMFRVMMADGKSKSLRTGF